ncbi:putative transmembrane protein [Toxoplasma gondii TgCatPRC2]|uniref:Transmembrane protein n=10 Tax=Toxoplasma gondii TaxID=5811 RepID=A0A125YRJ5_TOXGM|nr:hypothetical protein TGME49_238150 [Toxoplasma gondii ME49]ESS31287.1 putative transmembrane protein [Toxoplasma gondii VEG]KFG39372.1 putative transmembrane protein [Toxoplasma gondii p89]KFG56919.1 putative transmembrane protein [Toxoplasma gondii RUB]KFG99592.1 putative transmembrane protein [Toxoplasma gondii VAND]KFH02809.1 putative transmembrane protein [Toxoplasma gondii MAS]KYF38662.1 hypothetical protein TGARI_238150 [Toxoplasma gondii ARI]KYK62748.1 putative transmembrane protei|eukprot:XP_002366507.1 hypothetical protein TGME49_238150 [Toxoplasma gondii ME49]
MGKCKFGGEFDNPALSCWATSLTGQAVVALVLFLLAGNPHLPKDPVDDAAIPRVASSTFVGLGTAHLVVCAICAALCLVGFLLVGFFQLPLLICGIAFQILCVVTAGILGQMLTNLDSYKSTALDDVRAGKPFTPADFSQMFVDDNEGMILFVCVLCILMPIFVMQSKSLRASSPAYEATLYPGVIIVSLASAGYFLFCRASGVLQGLSSAWLIVGAVIGISVVIQKNCCSRALAIVLAVIFALGAVFALIVGIVVGIRYTEGKKVLTMLEKFSPNHRGVSTLEESDFNSFKTYTLAGDGVYLMIVISVNFSAIVYFIYSALVAFRSICGPNRNAAVKDEESVEQAEEA